MLELAAELLPLLRGGTSVAAVSVTRVVRSAPRGVGATLAVTSAARVIGSISGGCVEQDAVMLGLEALRTGRPAHGRFGFAGGAPMPAGLACGGAIEVVAYPLSRTDAATTAALEGAAADVAVSVGVVVTGPHAGTIVSTGDLAGAAAPPVIATDQRVGAASDRRLGAVPGFSAADRSSFMLSGAYDGADVLVLTRPAKPRLVILGAGEHAAALCRVAVASGFSVAVCDAWTLLATAARFPDAREVVVALPHEYLRSLEAVDARTAVCVLTHDERLDVPALRVALELPVGFVGAMGARATVARRAALLRQAGVSDANLARLHSPLGLDLGGSSPEETAVSVVAEIVASRYAASARSLSDATGPIHAASVEACGAPLAESVGA